MKSPRPGSRKAAVFNAFQQDGEKAALDKGAALKLKAGTIRSWLNKWKKRTGPREGGADATPAAVHTRPSPPPAKPPGRPNIVQRWIKREEKELVYEITFPQTRGVVVKAGEQISEVKWERATPWGKQSFVQNKYLRPASIKPATVE